MIFSGVLALDHSLSSLKDSLKHHVKDILDHLGQYRVLDMQGEDRERIEKQLTTHQQVEEMLRYLVRVDTGTSSNRHLTKDVFEIFCDVLRDIDGGNLADVASDLRVLEKAINDGNYSQQDADGCELLKKLTESCTEPHRRIVHKYTKHVRDLCQMACQQSDLTHGFNDGDVQEMFVSLEVLSQDQMWSMSAAHIEQYAATVYGVSRQAARGNRDGRAISVLRALGGGREGGSGRGGIRSSCHCLEAPSQLFLRNGFDKGGETPAGQGTAPAWNNRATKCMIIGGAGKGKTMLCRRAVADFVEHTSPSFQQDSFHPQHISLSAKFEFVIHVECRDSEIINSSDWSEFLGLHHPSLGFSKEERECVLKYLRENSEKVLLIIDGVDEVGNEGFKPNSAVLAFLEGKKSGTLLIKSSAIVTSRPCRQAFDLVLACDSYYQLRGFSESQLHSFVRARLCAPDSKRCIEQLSEPSNGYLKETIRETPLLCTLLCQQFNDSGSIPSCMTAFYINILCAAVSKLEKRQGFQFSCVQLACEVQSDYYGGRNFETGEEVDIFTVIEHHLEEDIAMINISTIEETPTLCVIQSLCDLYRLCFEGLKSGKFSFPSCKLSEQSRLICIKLGLILYVGGPRRNRSSVGYISLHHLTVQEFCASRCISTCDEVIPVVESCVVSIGLGEQSESFWKFLFGCLKSCHLEDSLKVLRCQGETYGRVQKKKLLVLLMRYALESRLANSESEDSLCQPRPVDVVAAKYLTGTGVDLSNIEMEEIDILALSSILELREDIETLILNCCKISDLQLARLSHVLVKAKRLLIRTNPISGYGLKEFADCCESSPFVHLEILDISFCNLTGQDAYGDLARIAASIELMRLDISGNTDFGERCLSYFESCFDKTCDSLTHLTLQGCNLHPGCGHDLAKLVGKMPNLHHLTIRRNRLDTDDLEHLLRGLRSHSQLENLLLECNELEVSTAAILSFLKGRRRLCSPEDPSCATFQLPPCTIHVSGNKIPELMMEDIAKSGLCERDIVYNKSYIVTRNQVQQRSLESIVEKHGGDFRNRISDDMMESLGKFIGSDKCLDMIVLASSQVSDIGAILLARHGLAFNTTLQFLDIHNNLIHIHAFVDMLYAMVAGNSGIRALSLSSNPIFESHADSNPDLCRQFIHLLFQLRSLTFLDLQDVGVTDCIGSKLIGCMLAQSSKCQVAWLNLQNNCCTEKTVAALRDSLKDNSPLKILGLGRNNITNSDVEHLLCSKKAMAMTLIGLEGNQCSSEKLQLPLTDADSITAYSTKETVMDFIQPQEGTGTNDLFALLK